MAALAVYGERLTNRSLNTESIQNRTKHVVVIKAIDERFIQSGFVSHGAIDHALIEVSGAQLPNLAGKHHVVTVMHLRKMIEGARLLGERQNVLAAIVLNFDVAFFDINVGRTVFAHGSELD